MVGGNHRLRLLRSFFISRGRIILVETLVFLLVLAGMAVSAAACEGVGGPELTTLSTSLSGEGKEGATITVLEGSKIKDKATLKGKNAATATGKVTYKVYSDSECKTLVTTASEVTVSGESVPVSSEEELEGGASYYWQAHYSGDSKNAESTSECNEISTVKAKTSLATKLSGESKEGEELEVLEGSKVKDKATMSGTKSSTAGGKVVYKIYSDKECKTLVGEAGEVTVSSGSVPASNEEELESGTYYWQAVYKGDSLHQESVSICGKEVLKVAKAEWFQTAKVIKAAIGFTSVSAANFIIKDSAGNEITCTASTGFGEITPANGISDLHLAYTNCNSNNLLGNEECASEGLKKPGEIKLKVLSGRINHVKPLNGTVTGAELEAAELTIVKIICKAILPETSVVFTLLGCMMAEASPVGAEVATIKLIFAEVGGHQLYRETQKGVNKPCELKLAEDNGGIIKEEPARINAEERITFEKGEKVEVHA